MSDDKTFLPRAGRADDEDDLVIQAGVRSDAQPAAGQAPAGAPPLERPAVVDGEHRRHDAAEPGRQPRPEAACAPKPRQRASATESDSYRETSLDDLNNTPMPLMQKIVLVAALLLVLGFVVYYVFLR